MALESVRTSPLSRLPMAVALDRLLAGEPAKDVLGYVLRDMAPGRVAVVASFGAESAVLLHLVAQVDPATPVVFLDTGMHFPETLAYRDELVKTLGLTDVRSTAPSAAGVASYDPAGGLSGTNPDLCCHIRKTVPLENALEGFDVWITGRKRHQNALRQAMPTVEEEGGRLKVNPLADWRSSETRSYMVLHELPRHPLTGQGYLSIGCRPCTSPVRAGEDERAGRWRGSGKTECGIHLTHNGKLVRVLQGSERA